jgi:signal transduction histidine kinase
VIHDGVVIQGGQMHGAINGAARYRDPPSGVVVAAADEAQRLREACHDMRQALAGVFALAGAALAEPELPAGGRERLEQIVGQAQWLADLIHDCLRGDEWPGDDTGQVDLISLAGEAVAAQRVTYIGELSLNCPAAPVIASGNRVMIRRIMANLLSNATRAAGPAGQVRIEIRTDRDRPLLIVDDSGPGFGRIEEGAGLGLRVVARSVDGCAGRLE